MDTQRKYELQIINTRHESNVCFVVSTYINCLFLSDEIPGRRQPRTRNNNKWIILETKNGVLFFRELIAN